MRVQVLAATMGQNDTSLLEKMNIQSDAIIANQCDFNRIDEFEWNGYEIRYLNFAERGVGLNRNNALMRADGDVCLFADDDMRYCENYTDIVNESFAEFPDADVLIFNLIEEKVSRYVIKKPMKVSYVNFLRYGTARIAVRRESVMKHGIFFNQCFGGGTEHCHGEDNLFLADCLRKRLKIYAIPKYIAELTEERPSSWNSGYDRKYLRDQGCLYKTMTRNWWRILCLQDAVRHKDLYKMSWISAYRIMTEREK